MGRQVPRFLDGPHRFERAERLLLHAVDAKRAAIERQFDQLFNDKVFGEALKFHAAIIDRKSFERYGWGTRMNTEKSGFTRIKKGSNANKTNERESDSNK